MRETLHYSCTLPFYGGVRGNKMDLVTYAHCVKADHKQKFHLKIGNLDGKTHLQCKKIYYYLNFTRITSGTLKVAYIITAEHNIHPIAQFFVET